MTVSISEAKNQYVYEVSDGGAKFERGGCDGIRVADKPKATLVMPPKGTKALPGFDIIVSWALGHEEVLISPAFRLESAESKEQNASSGNSKLSKKVEDSRDEGEEGEEESYTDVHHRAHLDGEEVPKHHSSDNDLTRRRPHLEEELEEGLEEGLEVHEEGEERGEGDKGKEGLHARTRTGDRPTAAHEQEDRGRAAGKEPPRLPAKEPQGAHELEELHTLAEHIHHLEPREKHVPLSTVFSRERDLYFHEKAESGHHRGAKADSGGSRGGSRGKSGVREKEGKVELKEGVKEGVRKEVKEEVKMEVRKEVKEVVSEVVKDELKEVEKEEVKEVKKEEVKEVEKEEVKGRRYEVRERIFDNIEKDSHQWDGESVRQVRGEGEERGEGGERGEGEEGGEGGERGEGEEGGEGGEKGRRDRHPGRLHSEEEHQQQPEGGRPVAHYDERQKGDKGDKGDKGEPSIHEDRHHQEEKEKEEGKGVREQGEGEEEQQEHHHAPSRLSEIEPDHHPIDHHHRDFFAPVANIRDRLQGSFKAHHEAVERMTKHAFEGFGGGFKTDPKADPDPIREHASGPSQETGIDSPLAESHGEVLGSQEPGPPRGERPARADRSAEEGSHGENLPREESPDEVSPHQETLEEHQRTYCTCRALHLSRREASPALYDCRACHL